MASVIENKREETYLWNGLDDFLEACIISKTSRISSERDQNKEMFEENDIKKIDEFLIEGAAHTLESFVCWWEPHKPKNYWVGITGSWRTINQEVVDDITEIVRYIINNNLGILTGGALGVDYIATEVVLREGNPEEQLRIALPINKFSYMRHFKNGAIKSVINPFQRNAILEQITHISNRFPNIVFDGSYFDSEEFLKPESSGYREACYSFRNNLVAHGCDGLIPFLVNNSDGVKDTVQKVKYMQKPVFDSDKLKYMIESDSEEVITDYSKIIFPNMPDKKYPLISSRGDSSEFRRK